jgi:hypothetical protein
MTSEQVLRCCLRTWARLGVPRSRRVELAAELRRDLDAAAHDGLRPVDVIGADPAAFARSWVESLGAARGRWRLGLVTVTALAGALPGTCLGLFAAYGTSSEAFASLFATHGLDASNDTLTVPSWLLVGTYVLAGLVALLGAVAACSASLRALEDPLRRATVRSLLVGLPFSTVCGLAGAITFGASTGFRAWPFSGVEALLVVLSTALGAASSRTWARLRIGRSPVSAFTD